MEVDIPQPRSAALGQLTLQRFPRSPSEVEVMQPIHNSRFVDLPVGLDLSRLR
jgi:hypothetical protein